MKKILLFISVFLLSMSEVYAANSTEALLNEISAKIKSIKEERTSTVMSSKYPVGSIYMSTSSTDPGILFGGTWESFGQGRTLIGVESGEAAGSEGGSVSSTLTNSNLPAHNHTYTAEGTISSTFTGTKANVDTNAAEHSHKFYFIATGDEAAGYGLSTSGGFGGRAIATGMSNTTGTAAKSDSHYHTLTAKGTVSSTFTGSARDTSSTGNGTSFSVLNPYVTVYMWKRIS